MNETIFYSWQSDTDASVNKILIRDALKAAVRSCNKDENDVKLRVDSDTLGVAGTPDIAAEIFRKIDSSSVFVADISIINPDSKSRKTPNPNVLIELGYAVRQLGWNRVICVFNSHYGEVECLPFDLRGRKAFQYSVDPKLYGEELEKKKKFVMQAILHNVRAVLKDKRPTYGAIPSEEKTPGNIKRDRDVATVTQILSDVSTSAIEGHIQSFRQSEVIPGYIFHHYYSFMNHVESLSFYIYDEELRTQIIDLWEKLSATLNHGEHFSGDNTGDFYRLYRGSWNQVDRYERASKMIHSEMSDLQGVLRDFIVFIKEKYIEIDIKELDGIARQKQVDEEVEIERRISGKKT